MEHRELLEEFFLEAFPNPDRIGCPDEDAMQALAYNGPTPNDSCTSPYRLVLGVFTASIGTSVERTQSAKLNSRNRLHD